MECGEDLAGAGFSIEIEYPLGGADLSTRMSTALCGDCASWSASDIDHHGVKNEVAHEEHLAIIEEGSERLNEVEARIE